MSSPSVLDAPPPPSPAVAADDVDERPPSRPGRTRRVLPYLALLALAVVVVLVTLVATDRSTGGALDPRSAKPEGARALATLLGERGVRVSVGSDAGTGTTVLVPFPNQLTSDELTLLLHSGADVVLIAPDQVTDLLGATRSLPRKVRQPGCDLPEARVAGTVHIGGSAYPLPRLAGDTLSCYDATLLVSPPSDQHSGRLVVLGDGNPLTNAHLAEQGNAALALGLLSAQPRLIWYQPVRPQQASLTSLLPDGVLWLVAQLFVAVVVLAIVRGRRLGPVVTEPLPVAVRGSETVEGRARLYAAARARDRAAAVLREGARRRLASRLRLGRRPSPDALVTAVAAHSGWSPAAVRAVLYGADVASVGPAIPTGPWNAAPPEPPAEFADDQQLVGLAADLRRLEQEVRRA